MIGASIQTRDNAYRAHLASGKLQDQEQKIMRVFHACGNEGRDFSIAEMADVTGIKEGTVSARFNRLKKLGYLEEAAPRYHAFSTVRVTPLRLPQKQRELF